MHDDRIEFVLKGLALIGVFLAALYWVGALG